MNFKEEWFSNEKWWFTPSEKDDVYICNKYKDLLYNALPTQSTVQHININDLLTQILINDQLTRHYKRVSNIDIIDERLVKALDYAQKLLKQSNCIKDGKLIKGDLSWKEWCFALLPFRHAGYSSFILQITECIINELKSNNTTEANPKFLRKYLKATFMRNPDKYLPLYENIKQNSTTMHCYDTILEYTGSHAVQHPFKSTSCKQEKHHVTPLNIKTSESNSYTHLISLSGGVDSMVLAHRYRDVAVAIHIDYSNRKESSAEAAFVQDWCFVNGIKCFTRVIKEINRETCMKLGLRDLYESYTKQVRFDTYSAVWKSLGKKCVPKVILGHHLDDCVENILCNISKLHWHDLNGMDTERLIKVGSTQINIIRPFLNIHKVDIIKEAKINGIPYLLDTTSANCSRGKLRNNVIPTLTNWNKQSMYGLYNLANMTNEASSLINILVKNWFEKLNSGGIIVDINDLPESKLLYREIFCKYNVYPSNKSIINFINCIKKIKKNWKEFTGKQKTEFGKNIFITIIRNDANIDTITVKINQD